jgi:cobalt/nickel transport system permease protein
MLPPWFQKSAGSIYRPASELADKKIRLHFLDRTLRTIALLLQDFILSEAYAQKPGWLQKLDPRAKLFGVLLLVVTTSLLHSIPWIYALYCLSLLFALFSRIDAGFFIRRVWLVLALFVGIIALPATLNIFTPGEPFFILYSLGQTVRLGPYSVPAQIAITREGIQIALLLVGRVATSLSFVLLLTLTTPWADLLKALRSFRIPQIYVQTLGMTLRYLMLLCQIVEGMHVAKKSRTLRRGKMKTEQRWVAGQVGTLFKRSMQLSMEVHRAMVARGFQGDVRILTVFQAQKRDYGWILFCVCLSGIFIYGGR